MIAGCQQFGYDLVEVVVDLLVGIQARVVISDHCQLLSPGANLLLNTGSGREVSNVPSNQHSRERDGVVAERRSGGREYHRQRNYRKR